MQTAVNVNADAEWDGVSQTIKEGLGKVHDEDEADQKELEQENKAPRAEMGDESPPKIRGGFFADRAAAVIEEAPLRAVDGGSLGDAAMEDDKKHLGGKRRDVLAGMRGRDAEEGGSLLEDVLRAMRRLAHDGAVADDRLCKNQAMAERSRFGIRGVAEDLA